MARNQFFFQRILLFYIGQCYRCLHFIGLAPVRLANIRILIVDLNGFFFMLTACVTIEADVMYIQVFIV